MRPSRSSKSPHAVVALFPDDVFHGSQPLALMGTPQKTEAAILSFPSLIHHEGLSEPLVCGALLDLSYESYPLHCLFPWNHLGEKYNFGQCAAGQYTAATANLVFLLGERAKHD